MLPVDLGDLHSVVSLCEALARDAKRSLDLVVLNAGVVPSNARPTAQGFELMFGVNYLANVLLVERLLTLGVIRPQLRAPTSAGIRVRARPIATWARSTSARLGRFTPYDAMGSMKVYGYSKLLLEVYAADLARRLGQTASVHSLCPGAVDTDIAREAPEWVKPVLGGGDEALLSRTARCCQAGDVPVLCARARRPHGTVTCTAWWRRRQPAKRETRRPAGALLRDSQRLITRALGDAG